MGNVDNTTLEAKLSYYAKYDMNDNKTLSFATKRVIVKRENNIEHTHAKIFVSALEHQVSRGDTYGEAFNQQCNLEYTSK